MRAVLRVLAVCFVLPVVPAAAVDVTTCGQVVPTGQAARLVTDLACASGNGVVLADRTRLYLDGHVLSGSADASNVVCQGPRCKIVGPGEIVGGQFGVAGSGKLSIADLVVRDQIRGGIDGLFFVRVRRVTMTGIGFGAPIPNLTEVIRTGQLRGAFLGVRDNAGTVSTVDYRLRSTTITDNGGIGIGGPGRGRLSHSTVTGNLGGPLGVPIDVFGIEPPKLIDTVCDHSYNADDGTSFGICQLD
jgi:hypothetical protein